MNTLNRIALTCRAAIAEIKPLAYFLPLLITSVITIFVVLVDDTQDNSKSQLLSEFTQWDPATIIGLIVVGGWIGGLILCGEINSNWFKEENQAARTLSLPVSNGERFAALTVLYLLFVPLVSFGSLLLFTFLVYPLAPPEIFLPSTFYLWKALAIGWVLHALTCMLWFQPSVAFGKRGVLIFLAILGLITTYSVMTHGDVSDRLKVKYTSDVIEQTQAVGVAGFGILNDAAPSGIIRFNTPPQDNTHLIVQAALLFLLLAAAGIALTKKTA